MTIRLLIAAALLAATSPLTAEPPPRAGVAVTYEDLDLTRQEDRATLDQRLAAAARSVCRALAIGGPFDLLVRARCERKTLAKVRGRAKLAAAQARRQSQLARSARAD